MGESYRHNSERKKRHTHTKLYTQEVLEMDGGDGCTIMWMYLLLLNCTLKMAKMINFMWCIFCCNINVHTIRIYFYKPQKQVKLTYSEKSWEQWPSLGSSV